MPTVYPSLKIGAKRRLDLFRKEAARPGWRRPMTWRDVRFATLKSPTGLDQGYNFKEGDKERTPIWSTQSGQAFERECFADKVDKGIEHEGWFADNEQNETIRGLVVRLPHGRFLAGYYMSMNEERVYFQDLFDDEKEAARFADSKAERIAESDREYDERYHAAKDLNDENAELEKRIKELCALRNLSAFKDEARAELAEKIEELRAGRERLASEFEDIQL